MITNDKCKQSPRVVVFEQVMLPGGHLIFGFIIAFEDSLEKIKVICMSTGEKEFLSVYFFFTLAFLGSRYPINQLEREFLLVRWTLSRW